MYFGMFDPFQIIIMIASVVITGWAQMKIRNAYSKYSQITSWRSITGADVARSLLRGSGLDDVRVERISGELTDHYDPRERVLRLSTGVYSNRSIAAIGIAAHEVGHAIQHDHGYAPLGIRNSLVPVANIGSQLAWPMVLIGIFFPAFDFLVNIGIILFAGAVVFQLITLPVELNASNRALALLNTGGYLQGEELEGAKKVLNAAALTYIAAAATAILFLIRLLLLRRDD